MFDFAAKTLHVTKFAVWDDSEPFGRGVADNFATAVTGTPGDSVVSRKRFDSNKKDFTDFLTDAKATGAQAIYVGGTSASAGCVARGQWNSVFSGTDLYYLGPDGIGDQQCITDSGSMATDHMYASQGVSDATQNPDAKSIVGAYKKAYPNVSDIGAYTYAGYDCAATLLDAINRAVDANGGNKPSRQQVVDALAQTKSFTGLTGVITFNSAGDPTAPSLQIQQVKNGTWMFVTQKAFTPSA
jgi:branched-chain amino acid transport system substrate-binding protein